MGKNPWSRQTYIARLSTLFEFSRRRRWISENPCFYLERVTIDQNAPSVLSAVEADRLWKGCIEPEAVRCCMACPRVIRWPPSRGSHDAEMGANRLRWRAHFHPRRNIQGALSSDCRATIKGFCGTPGSSIGGGQLPISNATKKRLQRRLRGIMRWKTWPKDILRHTCASHWLAIVPDAQRIALQLGNSPSILLRHYRSIVTKEDAERFWGITAVSSSPAGPAGE